MSGGQHGCVVCSNLQCRSEKRSMIQIIRQVLTLFAVSPFFAIRSAPTATRQVSMFLSDRYVLTDGMDFVMLEQGADHRIADHHRRYFERLKLVGCKSTKS